MAALEKLGFDRVLCVIQHRNALDKVWSELPKKSPPCVLAARFSAQQVAKPGPWRREVDSSGNEKCL